MIMDDDSVSVLFVIPYMDGGGAQRALSNIQMNMPDSIKTDTLVNSERGRVYPNKGSVISLGIDGEKRAGSVAFQFRVFLSRVRKLRHLKKNGGYRACISFIDSANIANIISSFGLRKSTAKTIISVRTSIRQSSLIFRKYRFFVKPLAALLYKRADLVVPVSEELKEELREDFGIKSERLVAIPNGFDVKKITAMADEEIDHGIWKRIEGKKVILTAGRLGIEKNQWHLIRAFAKVKEQVPGSVLIITGTGELEGYLRDLIAVLNMTDSVILTGYQNNVYKYMHAADVFVLPSAFEGFPNALGEALCTGTPCVVTDFKTGAREIIAPKLLLSNVRIDRATECEYGIITPLLSGTMYKGGEPWESQEMELADAIVRMIQDEELNNRYRRKSAQWADSFNIREVVKKWVSIVED